jgi:hypothetical protein
LDGGSSSETAEQQVYRTTDRKGVGKVSEATAGYRPERSPEEDLLDFFGSHNPRLQRMMEVLIGNVSGEERRIVALALITAVKKTAIDLRRPIPPELYDLERRFVEVPEEGE